MFAQFFYFTYPHKIGDDEDNQKLIKLKFLTGSESHPTSAKHVSVPN